jgi:hypothetical protein
MVIMLIQTSKLTLGRDSAAGFFNSQQKLFLLKAKVINGLPLMTFAS